MSRESEPTGRLTSLALESVQIPFVWVAPDSRIAYANAAACGMLGYEPEELVGLTIPDIDAQWSAEYWETEGLQRLREQRFSRFATRVRRKDGTVFDAEVSVTDVMLDDRQEMLFASVIDTSERTRAEQALRDSEERLRLALEGARMGTWEWEVPGDTLTGSLRFEQLLGGASGRFDRRYATFREAIHADDRAHVDSTFGRLVESGDGGDEIDLELRLLTPDDEVRSVRLSAKVVRREAGRAVCLVGTSLDVTERKKAEESLCYRVEFEALVAEISTRFINLPSQEIDAEIEKTLESLGRFCDVDLATVFLLTPDEDSAHWFAGWCRDSEWPPGVRNLTVATDAYPWATQLLKSGKPVILPDLDAIPEEGAALRKLYESMGLTSAIRVPLVAGGRSRGFIGFSTMRRRREWNDDDVALLNMIGQIIYNAMQRKRADDELRRALAEIANLKERLEVENVYLREEVRRSHGMVGVVGQSDVFLNVMRQVEQVGPTDASVLLLGETGTGKDVVARAIHRSSHRSERPFVKVDCAALSATLIESELFGHEKGAFTGALARTTGRFEMADGGTVFLDEIGDLPLELQSKLLRVLQDGEFERLGSPRTQKVDVRFIAATNHDLARAVDSGRFRADLYYRLSVFPILMPRLRDRREDIPLLVRHFIAESAEKLRKTIERVPSEVMSALAAYDWPGNLRELRNVVERAVIRSPGTTLRVDDPIIGVSREQRAAREPNRLADVERDHILRVVRECGWKIRGKGNAAEVLGLNASTLRSRMKKLGISRPDR